MTIAQTRKPGRQDLSQARNGTITGRGGRTQQLGAAAQRRLGQQPPTQSAPAKPAWQQLRDAGQQGTGSAAGNRAAAAGLPGGGPQIQSFPMPKPKPDMPGGNFSPTGGHTDVPMGYPGGVPYSPPGGGGLQMQSGGGFMGEPMPIGDDTGISSMTPEQAARARQFFSTFPQFGGGMASYTKPGAIGQMAQGAPGAAGGPFGPATGATSRSDLAASAMGAQQKPGVDSNPFAQVGGTPNGEPLQAAQGRAGQAGRIAQLIQRLRGGGQMAPDPMQFARPGGPGMDMRAY